MKAAAVRAAVERLVDCWHVGETIDELPEEIRPRTPADGMQVQDRLTKELGVEVGGWKIGATSEVARKMLKADAPFAGRILAPRIFCSGQMLPATGYNLRGVEAEIALVLERNLPARIRPYTRGEVSKAVGAVCPALEIVDSRFTDISKVNIASMIADMGSSAALVIGKPILKWKLLDLPSIAVTIKAGRKIVGRGTGAAAMGDPLASLLWLANHLRTRDGLKAGDVISTGTCTGLYRAQPGEKITAEFGKLGTVAVSFTK